MKILLLLVSILFFNLTSKTQDIYTLKSGSIGFFAGTPLEDIDATNTKITSFLNIKTGEVVISIPNNQFIFKRALMQEHFNENYMESEKYLKSQFKGIINDKFLNDLTKDGISTMVVNGDLNIHGVIKKKSINFNFLNNTGKIKVDTKFKIALTDYKIDRPQIVWEKLADSVQVSILLNYEIYKK